MRKKSDRRQDFEKAALPYIDELYAIAVRYTRNEADAQDLVQDTFLRAYAAWDRFIAGSNCRAWLIKILTNGFINTYRRGRSHRKFAARPGDEPVTAFFGEETRDRASAPEAKYVEALLGDEVTRALGELTEEYRVVVVLADLEGQKYRAIADILGVPVGTVMSRLFRARRQLEHKLGPYAAADYGIARRAA